MAPKVLLIGPGGIGALVAYGLYDGGKCDLAIVVRRDYERVIKEGYELDSLDYGHIIGWKPHHVFPTVEAAASNGSYEYIVVTTKNLPDVSPVEELVAPVMTPGLTTTVLIQNGFDNGRPLIETYPQNYCLSGVTHTGSHNHGGVVKQTQREKTMIGPFLNPNLSVDSQNQKAKEFIEIYASEKHRVEYFADTKWYRYRKLVYNATFNTSCALSFIDSNRMIIAGTFEAVTLPAMREVVKIAKADGVELPENVINDVAHSDDGMFFQPSMLVDVKKGNPIELEVILGNLLRRAKELEVDAPYLQVLYGLLKSVQYRLLEGKGLVKTDPTWKGTSEIYQ